MITFEGMKIILDCIEKGENGVLDYLTYDDYAAYSPQLKPFQQRNAGGMQSKTYRVRLALEEFFPECY